MSAMNDLQITCESDHPEFAGYHAFRATWTDPKAGRRYHVWLSNEGRTDLKRHSNPIDQNPNGAFRSRTGHRERPATAAEAATISKLATPEHLAKLAQGRKEALAYKERQALQQRAEKYRGALRELADSGTMTIAVASALRNLVGLGDDAALEEIVNRLHHATR